MRRDHLTGRAGKTWLLAEYVEKARSTYDIAAEMNTTAAWVRKCLKGHKIPLRSRSEAQAAAIASGRSTHPTRGRERTAAEKEKIGRGRADAWESASPESIQGFVDRGKKQWEERTEEQKANLQTSAARAVREAAKHGSKLERFLVAGLKGAGFTVNFHARFAIANEQMHVDLLVEDRMVAVEVDGPSHHLPIYGPERLEKRKAADAVKNGLLLQAGYSVVRVKCLVKTLSVRQCNDVLDVLVELVKSVGTSELKEIEVR